MDGYSSVFADLRPGDIRARALSALRRFVAAGTTVVRCQTGCGPLSGVTAVEVLAALRDDVAGVVRLEVVAHAAVPEGGAAAHRALLRRAVDAGADLIGGNPCIEADPAQALATCFEVAAERGCGVDLHVDESTDPSVLTLPEVARHAREHEVPVTAAHCVSLGSLPAGRAREVAGQVATAGVGVVALPSTNLYLQGRSGARHGVRGLTAIDVLRTAGVTVAAGSDNVQDPFNPMGRCDPLETASLLVTAGHQPVSVAAAMVGPRARALLGLPPAGPVPGAVADLVALRADGPGDAVARAPNDRIVWRHGRVVARTEVAGEVAL
jgi:cytosine deaminase